MAASTKNNINLSGLARKLVLKGLLEEKKAVDAFQEAQKKRIPFVSVIVEKKLVASDVIAVTASNEFGAPLVDIDSLENDLEVVKLVKDELIKKHHILPIFKRGKRLAVAISDPTNLLALDEIKFATNLFIDAVVVAEDKLVKHIEKTLEALQGSTLVGLSDEELEDLDNIEPW